MNPLNNNSYTFFLNFVNSFGVIEITEPVKFDGASFVVEQESKRYGRDVSFMNESIDLFFYKGIYEKTETPLQLPNGTILYNLTQGFEQLLEARNTQGWESEVEFIIKKDGVSFITGVLDFQNAETDERTFLSCKVVQDTNRQIIKRRDDIVVDMFSDENIDGDYIEPLQTSNILLKAKPITQVSEWRGNQSVVGFSSISLFTIFNNNPSFIKNRAACNNAQNVIKYGIDNTLTYISERFALGSGNTLTGENFTFIEAQNDLTDVEINLTNINGTYAQVPNDFFTDLCLTGNSSFKLIIRVSDDYNTNFQDYEVWSDNMNYNRNIDGSNFSESRNLPTDLSFNIPFIQRGKRVYIYFVPDCEATFEINSNNASSLVGYNTNIFLNQLQIDIKATSTAIDSVIKGVRYIDVLKQTVKSISGLPVEAPKFDNAGEFYEQFAFTGNLIKGRDDVAFPVKFKDAYETIQEVNADFQINDNEVFIGQYADFYPNKEIASFQTLPDQSTKTTFNNRFAINQFEFNYKTFEQDREETNTTDAIHTKSQWSINNKQVENSKKIELDQIRDAYKIESARRLAVKETTSETDDDKLFLIDVVQLAPNSQGGFGASLKHNVNSDGDLQLLNDGTFSWGLLGFGTGDDFTITNTSNNGVYTVVNIESSIITLSGNTPTSIGEAITTVSYFYSNVLYTNRTNEGLIDSENLLNSDNYSNLKYSIKRNIKTWLNYLSTSFRFLPNGELKNTYFKNNGIAATQFTGEDALIVENSNILKEDLDSPVLTPNVYEVKLVAGFTDAVNLVNELKTITDGTVGGFIRTYNNNGKVIKGYPMELNYEPSTETLTAKLEERYESDFLTIVKSGDTITINEVGYDAKDLAVIWYEIHNDYLTIYDSKGAPVINPTHYDKVSVNSEIFTSKIELSNKLIEIS